MSDLKWYQGFPVCIATQTIQKRKHHKKRINKKWLKRYGCYEYNMMPHDEVVLLDNHIFMTKRTWERLSKVRGKNDNSIMDYRRM